MITINRKGNVAGILTKFTGGNLGPAAEGGYGVTVVEEKVVAGLYIGFKVKSPRR